MARTKKNKGVTSEYQVHTALARASHDNHMTTCSEAELNTALMISINAFLSHIDLCVSRLVDYKESEVNEKNAPDT